jgi:VWFA-related protein
LLLRRDNDLLHSTARKSKTGPTPDGSLIPSHPTAKSAEREVMTKARTLPKLTAIFLCWIFACAGPAATQTPQNPDEVVRVYTELVQTDVMVFDKSGGFVNGLRREDFEIFIDGKPRPIEFFERITAGSANEEVQLAAARGSLNPNRPTATGATPLDRGRTVFFYVDDMHLDQSSASLTRKMINQYIDKEMSQNDQAAITSASGQIGFLGQLTDNRVVLRAALDRIKPRSSSRSDLLRPPMTEYQALLISRYDRDTTDFFVEALLREMPMTPPQAAVDQVRGRAHDILMLAGNLTRITLGGLEGLVKSSSRLPGRKVVFFVSSGFLLDNRNTDSLERIQRVTSAAARSGVVIYSMDARGLVASLVDASSDVAFDPSGRLDRAGRGELFATQDAMNALAKDTGGRPIFNTNTLEPGLRSALSESSTYYLLAWKPEAGTQGSNRFRKIEVKLVGKPDLSVRMRKGFFDVEPEPNAKQNKKVKPVPKTPDTELRDAVIATHPVRSLPIALSLSHVNTPDKGQLLSTALQIPGEFLTYGADADKSKAVVDVAGVIYDSDGKVASRLTERVTIISKAAAEHPDKNPNHNLTYNFPTYVPPGLYQVRVGARDLVSGRVGSAHEWIEIPNMSSGQLALSSVLLGERKNQGVPTTAIRQDNPGPDVSLSVTRRFNRDSYLRLLVFIYNVTQNATTKADAAIQVQLVRDGQPVVTTAQRKLEPEGNTDPLRLPYAAEVPLTGLPPGQYIINVTVLDRLAKKTATQQTRFEVL